MKAEIIAHIAASATTKNDRRYQQLARNILEFRPLTVSRVFGNTGHDQIKNTGLLPSCLNTADGCFCGNGSGTSHGEGDVELTSFTSDLKRKRADVSTPKHTGSPPFKRRARNDKYHGRPSISADCVDQDSRRTHQSATLLQDYRSSTAPSLSDLADQGICGELSHPVQHCLSNVHGETTDALIEISDMSIAQSVLQCKREIERFPVSINVSSDIASATASSLNDTGHPVDLTAEQISKTAALRALAVREIGYLERGYWAVSIHIVPQSLLASWRSGKALQDNRSIPCLSRSAVFTADEFARFWERLSHRITNDGPRSSSLHRIDIKECTYSRLERILEVGVRVYCWGKVFDHILIALEWALDGKTGCKPLEFVGCDGRVVLRLASL